MSLLVIVVSPIVIDPLSDFPERKSAAAIKRRMIIIRAPKQQSVTFRVCRSPGHFGGLFDY
jgi:hypothetical protein